MNIKKLFLGALVLGMLVASSASAATYMWTSSLSMGSTGTQVKDLQKFLNMYPAYQVSTSGAGAPGMESSYFGAKTKAAVVKFQAANGVSPIGIFGPASRAAAVALQNGTPGNVGNLPPGCTSAAGWSPSTGVPCSSGTVTQTGPVMATIATDNPASGAFIAPAAGVEFAKYAFTGSGVVTSVKLLRTGISSSTTLSNVYLYDGATRLTDGASIGSDNTVTFNNQAGLFTVSGSKTITVVATTVYADFSLGLNLIGFTANGMPTNANVTGNLMYGASATLSTLSLSASTGSGATDPGSDITVWQSTATNSTRDVILKSLALRQIGSIASADIRNFKLYVDGVLVSTVSSLDSNGYVTFVPNKVLTTGGRVLKVTADVVGGSGRTVSMSLRSASDIIATDTQYNANGIAIGTFPNTATAFTVNSGTLTVVKASDSASSNVTIGASDKSLAKYTFTAYGEAVKIESLRVGMITTGGTVTDNTIRNVRILVNGAQVGSNTDVPAAASFATDSGTSFTTNFTVYPGTPTTVEINADIYDSKSTNDIAATTTTAVQAVLIATTGNAVPQVSLGTISVPSSNKDANNLTIASGLISIAKTSNYTDRSISVPVSAYKIGSFQLSGNSTEAVNLNTMYVGFTAGSIVTEATDLSDLYVVYGGTMSPVKGTVSATVLNGNSFSINKTLAMNETMQIDVYATLASTVSTNAIITTMAVAGTTASSGIAVYADGTANTVLDAGLTGQTVTGAAGTLVLSQDASTAPAAIVDDNSTVKTLAAKFVAVTDEYTVTDMTVTVSNASAVSSVTLKDHDTGAVIGASKPGATSLSWSGLSFVVPAGATKKVDVELTLGTVGVGGGSTGSLLTTAISAFTARNSAGMNGVGTSGTATGNVMYVYKAIPTVSLLALPTSVLQVGTNTISKFSISSGGTGTIAWNRFIFNIAKTSVPELANGAAFTLWNSDSGTQVLGTFTIRDTANAATCLATLVNCRLQFVPTNEEQITGSKNYELRATVGGTLVATDYISTTFSQLPSVFATSTDYVSAAAAGSFAESYAGYGSAASFIWSDVSASSHATTVTTDWSNDYLVRSLPLSSQTLTK